MSNLHTVELRLTATKQIVSVGDLAVDPRLQMRADMRQDVIEEYAESIDEILEEAPLSVVEVEGAVGTHWYLVDGFHRYHAALHAAKEAVTVELMKGSWEDAVLYAMTSNGKHGLKAEAADKKRAIETVLSALKPDFGYNSKAVVPWLTERGFQKRTAEKYTGKHVVKGVEFEGLRNQIDAKRDAKILELLGTGKSQRDVASEVGCGQKTVSRIFSESNAHGAEKTQEAQDYQKSPETAPFDADEPFFDEEDCDTTPAINPADAFQKALDEHEAERQETTRQQDNSVSSSSKKEFVKSLIVKLSETLEAQGEDAVRDAMLSSGVDLALFNKLADLAKES